MTIVAVLVYAATVPAVAFPVLFATRSNWRATLAGRALMQFSTSAAVVMLLAAATTAFGDYPFRETVRLIAYGFLVVSLWRQVFVLLTLQREEHSDDQQARDSLTDAH